MNISKLTTFCVFLRGVMPAGKNRVPMAQLRTVLTESGFTNVRTWIQSGNVLVDTYLSVDEVVNVIHGLIKNQIGADLAVVVRTHQQIQQVLEKNPFAEGYDQSRVFFTLFASPPSIEKAGELMQINFNDEKLFINSTSAYMYIPGDASRSRLSNNMLEKKLGIAATTRNFNTMQKMLELSK